VKMRRRDFLGILGTAVVGWPFAARAQQHAPPVVGFVHSQSFDATGAERVRQFNQGLKDTGYVDKDNVTIEARWAEGRYDRLPSLVTELVRRNVSVIAATGGTEPVSAAKKATSTIPIVFITGADPVALGLVTNLSRPEGNLTGVTSFTRQLGSKQLGLLQAVIPSASVIAVFVNRNQIDAEVELKDIQEAAHTSGLRILPINISGASDLEKAFATLTGERANGLLIGGGAFFSARRVQIAVLAARHAVPTIYSSRDFTVAGGLLSYGASLPDLYRQVGVYTGKILQGAKPADMPVLQPTKFELVINRSTARALGLAIPSGVMAIADEVIE
jgi:putative ABC transport system substrate-binding protein